MVLMKNEAWVVRRPYELSGALISSNASVGVLAGAQWTTYSTTSGAVNEQLPPVTALGKDHVTLGGRHDRPVAVVQVASGNYPVVVVISRTASSLTSAPRLSSRTSFSRRKALHIIAKASKLDNIRNKAQPSAFLAPLAAQYETINPLRDCASTTNAEAGDTVDNDCDGMVDEDDCSTAGIDCRQTVSDGVKDVWGTEFAMPIPEHLGSLAQVNFTLAVTTVSTASVIVGFTKPGDATFPANPSHALVGDRSSRVVRVTSTEEVSFTFQLYGVVGAGGAGGAMRVLPLDALGNEYYIVTVCMDLLSLCLTSLSLVVQVLKNLPSNFKAGMLVVNPWAQYSDRDVYAFQQQALNSDKVLVVYAVGEPAPAVTVDANSFCDVKTAGGSFGGFVDTLGFKEDITSLAFVLESNQLRPLILLYYCYFYCYYYYCYYYYYYYYCYYYQLTGFFFPLADTDGDERFNEDCEALPEVTTTEQPDVTTTEQAEEVTTEAPVSEVTTSEATPALPDSVTTTVQPTPLASIIRRELNVDKSELSATRRKKISIPDHRPSAQTVGYMGVIVIVGVVVGIFLLDVGALYRDVSQSRRLLQGHVT
nr:hypothetical protein BaRGS_015999 [Batillaria attramentaria]